MCQYFGELWKASLLRVCVSKTIPSVVQIRIVRCKTSILLCETLRVCWGYGQSNSVFCFVDIWPGCLLGMKHMCSKEWAEVSETIDIDTSAKVIFNETVERKIVTWDAQNIGWRNHWSWGRMLPASTLKIAPWSSQWFENTGNENTVTKKQGLKHSDWNTVTETWLTHK